MLFYRKKLYLFTYGSYFWGYKHDLIKAIDESYAIHKFLNLHYLERQINKNGDFDDWTVKEINVIRG